MKTHSLFALLLSFGATAVFAQRDYSKVEITATPVAKNIYMLQGAGGNIGALIGPEGNLIVDDQFAPLAPKIDAALQKLNPGKLKFVLNTHHHGDHTGGNATFGAKDALIIAQSNVRKRLAAETEPKKEGLPVITFEQAASVHFNGEEIKVTHLPSGHTNGDCVVYFTGANVVHMGDDFFVGRFPFVDLNFGGSVDGLIKNIAHVISLMPTDVKIIPGHGAVSTLDDLKAYQHMLITTTGFVRAKIKTGKDLKTIQAEGFPEEWKAWGTGFISADRWIETIQQSSPAK